MDDSTEIEFMCMFCLLNSVFEFDGGWEYPPVCPHCRKTQCDTCGAIIVAGARWCYNCGEIAPEPHSILYRASSTSAAYAEENWKQRAQAFMGNRFADEHADDGKYQLIYDLKKESNFLETPNGERRKLTEEEKEEMEGVEDNNYPNKYWGNAPDQPATLLVPTTITI